MKNKIILIWVIVIAIISLGTMKVEAASASVKPSKTSVEVGDKVNITVTFTAAAWNLKVSGDGISSKVYASQTSDLSEKTTTESISLDTSKKGTYKISLVGDITDKNGNTKEINTSTTVTVKAKSVTNNTTASSEAELKNLGITPNDFSGFKSGTTSYNVTVPNSVSKISIYATPKDSKASVSGTGSKTLNLGKNTFKVKVTAEDKKTTKTYTLNITRKEEEKVSTDATLKNLGITPNDFSGFKPGTTSYNVTVPNDISAVTIYATPTNSKATVSGKGLKDLEVGENTFEVKVTAEDKKTTKTYTLKITREEKGDDTEQNPNDTPDDTTDDETETPTTEVVGITNITIDGYTLEPEFSNDVYEYTLDVREEISKIDITTETSSSAIDVDIAGNSDLQIGENVITLLAYNKDDDTTTTYQIIANIENEEIDLTEVNYAMDKTQTELNKKKLILIVVIILIIALIIVFLVYRYKLQQNETTDNQRYEREDNNKENYRSNEKRKGKRFK